MPGWKKFIYAVSLVLWCACCAFATDAQLSFVYERSVKVVSVESQAYKDAAKDPNLSVRVSRSNPKQAWVSEKVAVRDEKHLLELLGAADGNTWKLSGGQKSLLETFRFAKSDSMKSYLAGMAAEGRLPNCRPPGCVTVNLDCSAFSKGKVKKDYGIDLRKDFWALSYGTSIFIGSAYDSGFLSMGNPKATLIHEFSHCIDGATRTDLDYGLDGTHFGNEKTNGQTAFVEGWAEYNEMLSFGMEVLNRRMDTTLVKDESDEKSGKYSYSIPSLSKMSGQDLLSVEAVDAVILYRLSKEIPGGRDRVKAAFLATNTGCRDMTTFLRAFVAANPDQAQKVLKILDQETKGKLSESDFNSIIGNNDAVDQYIQGGRKSLWAKLRGLGSSVRDFFAKGWNALLDLFRKDKSGDAPVATVTPTVVDQGLNTTVKGASPVSVQMDGRTPFGE